MSTLHGFLLVGIAWGVLLVLWKMLNLVSDMLEIWHAARRGEDSQATKGKGSSLS